MQTGEKLGIEAGDAIRRFLEPFTIRILPDRQENLADC